MSRNERDPERAEKIEKALLASGISHGGAYVLNTRTICGLLHGLSAPILWPWPWRS